MPTPWTTVAQQWVLEGSPDPRNKGLYGFIKRESARLLVGANSAEECDVLCKSQMDLMTDFYRQKLMEKFQNSYPRTIEGMQKAVTRRIERMREFQKYQRHVMETDEVQPPDITSSGFLPFPADSSLFDSVAGVFAVAIQTKPALYLVEPPINSSLLANVANNGDFGGDVTNDVLYINHGTKVSPQWDIFDPKLLINYLVATSELLNAGYIRTLFYLKGYGTVMDAGDFEYRMDKMPTAAGISLKQAIEAENLAFGLVDIDQSGDGLITEFEAAGTTRRKWFF